MKKSLLTLCISTAVALPAFAGTGDFTDGGFESVDLVGWTHNSGVWSANGTETLNNAHQADSALITDKTATDANTNGNLREVLSGNQSYRLNNAANGAHFSTLSQTVTDYAENNLYFGFAAVLENPFNPHTEAQTPKFSFTIQDVTTGITLYNVAFDSRNATSQGITWHTGLSTSNGPSTWMYSDWNVIHVDTSALLNHTFTLTVMAYDCALGGHGGYAYIDSFQPTEPVANAGVTVNKIEANTLEQIPEPSSVGLGLLGGALLLGYRRRRK